MTKKSKARPALPERCQQALLSLGENLTLARKRRNMTRKELADRMFVSPKTVQRMENGDPGMSVGVLTTALLCLNMEKNLDSLAAMETDTLALARERQQLLAKKRIRKTAVVKHNNPVFQNEFS